MRDQVISADDLPTVEWDMFDRKPKNLVECTCGEMYHTHTKLVMCGSRLGIMTREACPECDNLFGHTVLHKPKQ